MANVENITKVRDAIQNEENFFNMAYWNVSKGMTVSNGPTPTCNTASCIGGWAEAIMKSEGREDYWLERGVAKWLGLDPYDAADLFYPGDVCDYKDATRVRAIEHLNNIIETGKVDWRKVIPEELQFAKSEDEIASDDDDEDDFLIDLEPEDDE